MAAEGKSVKRAILTIVLMLALPVGVAAQSAPDLVVLGPNVSNSSPEAGDTFWFIATVTNQGDERSAPTTVRYYRSTDATSDLEEGTDAVGAKGHHQGYAATIRLTAPSTAGTYYYRACVDAVPGNPTRRTIAQVPCRSLCRLATTTEAAAVTEAAVVAAAAALHGNPLLLAAPVRQPLPNSQAISSASIPTVSPMPPLNSVSAGSPATALAPISSVSFVTNLWAKPI